MKEGVLKRAFSLLVLFLETVLLCTLVVKADSSCDRVLSADNVATIRITVPDEFPTIQQAVDAVDDGDTVFVKSGIYYEHVWINKNIALVGADWTTTIIDGNGSSSPVVSISYQVSANVSGFTIRNATSWGLNFGTWARTSALPRVVTEVTFVNCFIGLWVNGSECFTIYHNSFLNCTYNARGAQRTNSTNQAWNNSCEGNYWGPNYNGTDADKDGVGDTPYLNMSVCWDFYPLMNPYIRGDINHDAIVDIFDGILLGAAYGKSPSDAHWNPHCDLNEDHQVDIFDALLLADHFNQHIA